MPEVPARLLICCTADGEPLAGAFVSVRLPMWSKNQYSLVFGPSDPDGSIRSSGDELAKRARAVQGAFPMDYTTFPEDWTGDFGVEILDRAGVQRLREAIDVWGEQFYPPNFAHTLDSYDERLRTLAGRRLDTEVTTTFVVHLPGGPEADQGVGVREPLRPKPSGLSGAEELQPPPPKPDGDG